MNLKWEDLKKLKEKDRNELIWRIDRVRNFYEVGSTFNAFIKYGIGIMAITILALPLWKIAFPSYFMSFALSVTSMIKVYLFLTFFLGLPLEFILSSLLKIKEKNMIKEYFSVTTKSDGLRHSKPRS